MRNRPLLIAVGLIGIVLLGALGWYLASPLFFDRTVDEALPIQTLPAEQQEVPAAELTATAAPPDKVMDEPMPPADQPIVLRTGEFVDADSFHRGSGLATILQLPDGSRLLRLEDFMVTNGPDLHVILATSPAPTDRSDLGEHLDLGELKGNIGNQNYEIPAGIDLSRYRSVVIYCVPFHVVFSTATLSN